MSWEGWIFIPREPKIWDFKEISWEIRYEKSVINRGLNGISCGKPNINHPQNHHKWVA
jgi:hypothetical protein